MGVISLDESPTEPAGRKLALLIGIDSYEHGVPALRNAVRDVQAVAEVLSADHGYSVRCLLNEQATGERIRQELSALTQEIGDADRFVFYFAGHGIAEELDGLADGPQGYLLPQDARRDDVGSFLPMQKVHALLSAFRCKQ